MQKGSFEGWFFKQNTYEGDYTVAFIVGRASDSDGKEHAFIQMNQTGNPRSLYASFPVEQFSYTRKPFTIKVGEKNLFSLERMSVNITQEDCRIFGELNFENRMDIRRNFYQPSIMGPFGYLPFLECRHEIYSVNHRVNGTLFFNEKVNTFTGGNGYIESDKGVSFPKNWIWLQSNHFSVDFPVSVMCAIAKVPVLGASIQGLLCVLLIEKTEYRFSTYSFTKIKSIQNDEHTLQIDLQKGDLELILKISGDHAGILKAPDHGDMCRLIKENLDAQVFVKLIKNGNILFKGTGTNAGYEIHNAESFING